MTTPPKLYDYIMPHPLDRIGQTEAFNAIMKWFETPDQQYLILSAPTGIGKTGLVAELSQYAKVMALVRTKVLQEAVYLGDYDFDLIKGKRNYPCNHSPNSHQADVCAITTEDKYDMCEGSGRCEYFVKYEKFCRSHKASTTYAKFISDRRPYNTPDVYVFDEAHEVPEIVIEQSGVDLSTGHIFLKGFGDLDDNHDIGFGEGIKLMRRVYSTALKNVPKLKKSRYSISDAEKVDHKRKMIRHRYFLKRVEDTAKLMIQSDSDGLNIWHYSSTSDGNFSARPMTASYHFKNILNTGSQKTLLMTATITPLMAEMLGLEDDEFTFHEAPQQFPVSMRPIYDLGQPGMGTKATRNNPVLWNIQALKISNVLKLRPDVSSVVLVTSKVKAENLADRLQNLGHDTFLPPIGLGTDIQLRAWENYRKPGAVCVSYNFWEGVSLDLDHMLFIAGIKYPDLSSAFERARANRSWKEFKYRAAINVVQGAGRIQRGHFDDYLPIGNKQVFIVDGNWTNIKGFAPGDFAERIIPWEVVQ